MDDPVIKKPLYQPHSKQKEFLESEERGVFFSSTYPQRATGALSWEMLKKFIEDLKIKE